MKGHLSLLLRQITKSLLLLTLITGCQTPNLNQAQRMPFMMRPLNAQQNFRFFSKQQKNFNVYYGNLHSHTSYSDGVLNPRDAYKMANHEGLDFMAVTEHNHSAAGGNDGIHLTPELYEDLKSAAREMTRPGEFAALYGQEVSTISSGNHVNVFEASSIVNIRNGDFKALYEQWLPSHKEVPFIQFNHPNYRRDMNIQVNEPDTIVKHIDHDERREDLKIFNSGQNPVNAEASKKFNDYGYDDYNRDFRALTRAANPYVRTIEMINGPGTKKDAIGKVEARHEADYLFYLNQGFKFGPSGDQDNHHAHWGRLSFARTGVLARSLTKKDIYEAFKARRTFATEDKNLSIVFKANGHYMGDVFRSQRDVNFDLILNDLDEPQAKARIEIYIDKVGDKEAKPVLRKELESSRNQASFHWIAPSKGQYYAFAKIIQTNLDGSEDEAWSAPVWMGM